jgi:hypothetical protein
VLATINNSLVLDCHVRNDISVNWGYLIMILPLRQRLEQEKGKLQQVRADIAQTRTTFTTLQVQAIDIEQAALIHRTVAQETQQKLSWYIDDMVTFAIEAIFPDDPAQFKLEFVQRRGKTEADLWLADSKENKIKPQDDDGGGIVNVVAFALRPALWSLTKTTRPVFILDEPVHYLHSRDAQARFADLLYELSQPRPAWPHGLQFIIITGEDESEEIIGAADKVFRIIKKNAISTVEQIIK